MSLSVLFTENPWPVLGVLAVIAAVCLILFRVTQLGKYLIVASVALVLGLSAFVFERLYVTDRERVEAVVEGVRKAAQDSNPEALLALMDFPKPSAEAKKKARRLIPPVISVNGIPWTESMARGLVKASLEKFKFDFITVTALEADAGAQTRQGTATFKVLVSGSYTSAGQTFNFARNNTEWTFGVRESEPGVWKITRIDSSSMPEVQKMVGAPVEGN